MYMGLIMKDREYFTQSAGLYLQASKLITAIVPLQGKLLKKSVRIE
jgi:hypothetical protein